MYNRDTERGKPHRNQHKEGLIMSFASISNSEKFWEIIHISITLTGEERDKALERLQVPANPRPAA